MAKVLTAPSALGLKFAWRWIKRGANFRPKRHTRIQTLLVWLLISEIRTAPSIAYGRISESPHQADQTSAISRPAGGRHSAGSAPPAHRRRCAPPRPGRRRRRRSGSSPAPPRPPIPDRVADLGVDVLIADHLDPPFGQGGEDQHAGDIGGLMQPMGELLHRAGVDVVALDPARRQDAPDVGDQHQAQGHDEQDQLNQGVADQGRRSGRCSGRRCGRRPSRPRSGR